MTRLPKIPQELVETLLRADTEADVIDALKSAELWDDPNLWRYYGDKEANWAQIGGQQAQPESSLTEKLTNSIDAILLAECHLRRIDPESANAPKTMAEAVATFFGSQSTFGPGETLSDWSNAKRQELSRRITIAVTGNRQRPSITIADLGEGQRPDLLPYTLVSLDRQNKARIHFVQGKFNQGGSGVLRFCGHENIQLVVSKRHPGVVKALNEKFEDSSLWGFTVVRREPTDGRSSTYTYLAPIGADKKPRKGEVLRFASPQLRLMPNQRDAYGTSVEHGTAIKLYEYDAKGFAGNAILPDGLRERLEAKLPEPALPMRIHECRQSFRGHKGSFETYVYGVTTRLAGNTENLEPGFPASAQFAIAGERLSARIYAFKPQKLKTYFSNEGVILMMNGQTHAVLPQTFFLRKGVKMDRLAGSLLLMIDCTTLSQRAREDLFMTSRDRLSGIALSKQLQEQLVEVVSRHPGLRELAERRKREEIDQRLKEDRPLEKILERLLRTTPELERLFPAGMRLPTSIRSGGARGGTGEGGRGDAAFVGKPHPTFFRFEKRAYGQVLLRNTEIDRRCRLRLETDAVNDYLTRDQNPGFFDVSFAEEASTALPTWSVTLQNGIAQVSLDFGDDVKVGDVVALAFTVNDRTLIDPFVNVVRLMVSEHHEHVPGSKDVAHGSRARGKADDGPGGLGLPRIVKVRKENWELRGFDQMSSATLLRDEDQLEVHVNVDNMYLKHVQKATKEDPRLAEARFVFGNVLLSLAVYQRFLQLEKSAENDKPNSEEVSKLVSLGHQRLVEELTRATAPFLLPMIERLGTLADEDIETVASIADED